jgi:hypothetical protein
MEPRGQVSTKKFWLCRQPLGFVVGFADRNLAGNMGPGLTFMGIRSRPWVVRMHQRKCGHKRLSEGFKKFQ